MYQRYTPRSGMISKPDLPKREYNAPATQVTLRTIADRLGISTATVSLALRNIPSVAERTRDDVRRLATELGYSYNRRAGSLRTNKSGIVAVGFNDVANPLFAEMLGVIDGLVRDGGRNILLATYGEDAERQADVLAALCEHRPDGMIVCPAGNSATEAFDRIRAAGIPLVQLSREVEGSGFDFTGVDDVAATTLAVEHLSSLGHRRIAMIGGPDTVSTGRARVRGYTETMTRLSLPLAPELLVSGYGTRQFGFDAIRSVMGLPDPPTAAVCFNDLTAFGAMLGLQSIGISAGPDFSLVGCDDVGESALWQPGLTTVHTFHSEMAMAAASMLTERMADPQLPARRILLEPSLIVRGSTGPNPQQPRTNPMG